MQQLIRETPDQSGKTQETKKGKKKKQMVVEANPTIVNPLIAEAAFTIYEEIKQ